MLKPINPYAQMITGVFTAIWGLWLLSPVDVFGTAPLFSKMASFAPEWAWGSWAFTCGSFIILGVLKGMYKFLLGTLEFAIWHWGTVSMMMWWGDWENTGGITYSFVAVLCVYSYLNIKFNYVRKNGADTHFRPF
jgi:hypothetical protein